MMKLQNKAGYFIKYDTKYICVAGKSLSVYGRNNFQLVCRFSDSKDYSHVEFLNEDIIVSKSSSRSTLLYSIYSISDEKCILRIPVGPLKESQSSSFILSPDRKFILDAITVKLVTYTRFYRIKIETGSQESVRLGDDVRVIQDVTYDYNTDKVFVMHYRAAGMIDGELKMLCTITQVDHNAMACEDIYTRFTPIANSPLLFFDNRYILYEDMEIIDIFTGHAIGKINYPYQRMQHGYFVKAYFSTDRHYLFFIYSERIIVIDHTKNEVVKEYEDKYCSYALIIDNKILIATWEKVYIIDF